MSAKGTAAAKQSATPTAARDAKAAKKAAGVALDTEQIADAVVTSKPKAKKIPAALNLMPTPKTAKPANAVKPAPVANGSVPAGEKFCPFHQTAHPVADFASNAPAKDHLYYICRRAEAEKRAAAKAAATA